MTENSENNLTVRYEALKKAFVDPTFTEELKSIEGSIKTWLTSWLENMPSLDKRINNVYSIESRVKGIQSFEEKIYRKDYINRWLVSADIKENQNLIKKELTDLIGFRINCHFVDYEKTIYDYLLDNAEAQEEKGFKLNFGENTEQKNGHVIYKFSGMYKDEYHFEVQIKSLIHNVWGEVEHKTVYKNPVYDGFYDQKRYISETLHDVMLASDRELHTLFEMRESEEQMLRSLFFIYTCKSVASKCKTNILGSHYNSYFRTFSDIEPYKKFVICSLSGAEYQRSQIQINPSEFYVNLKNKVCEIFPIFYLECLYHIDSELNVHNDFDSFLIYFLQNAIVDIKDDFDDELGDFNGGDEEGVSVDPIQDYLVQIDQILGTRIFKNKTKE